MLERAKGISQDAKSLHILLRLNDSQGRRDPLLICSCAIIEVIGEEVHIDSVAARRPPGLNQYASRNEHAGNETFFDRIDAMAFTVREPDEHARRVRMGRFLCHILQWAFCLCLFLRRDHERNAARSV
jgi:hypothetical protein